VKELIGTGTTGQVSKGVCRTTNEPVAIKTLSKKNFLRTARSKQTTKREIEILSSLTKLDSNHPNIIKLRAVMENKDNLYIVMEFIDGGELFDRVLKRNGYEEKDAKILFKRLISTLNFLHNQGVVHRSDIFCCKS
jgi:serine/threonine protein kinase